MKYILTKQETMYGNKAQLKCITIFLLLYIPILLLVISIKNSHPAIFQLLLFTCGWFAWTFFEYLWHRFYTHRKTANKTNTVYTRHQHHHTHPTDIKVTGKQRLVMFGISISLITISIYLHNYFTFIAGIWVGINWFFLMHYFLHKRWAKKVFPGLLSFHIVHHCKNPDRCFCFSLTLWDRLFNTAPSGDLIISPRVADFYFGNTLVNNNH